MRYFVRSPHAFARIVSIDTSGAANAPGVIAVLTAKDMEGVGNFARHPPLPAATAASSCRRTGRRSPASASCISAKPVAMVVAESALIAQDAAEFVTVEYEELTPVDRRARRAQSRRAANLAGGAG